MWRQIFKVDNPAGQVATGGVVSAGGPEVDTQHAIHATYIA